ncbi:hypothetical protein [Streptomyces sp. NPDC051776]|uniref:hypothetical protein n=1 Tax=Streptomyces sp. NPDC051776 TaxID=3155414 RepID=UPI00342F70FA
MTEEQAQRQYGMPTRNFHEFQRTAQNHGLRIDVRPTTRTAPEWLQQGMLPKPKDIKAKTINELDVHLGARAEDVGLVGYFQPVKPQREDFDDVTWGRIEARFEQREDEFQQLAGPMAQLADQGRYKVENGLVLGKNAEGAWTRITGDHDLYNIRTPGGSSLTLNTYNSVIDEMMRRDIGVMHGAHVYWDPESPHSKEIFDRIVQSHQEGGEPLLRFEPNGDAVLAYPTPPVQTEAANHSREPQAFVFPPIGSAEGPYATPPVQNGSLAPEAADHSHEPQQAPEFGTNGQGIGFALGGAPKNVPMLILTKAMWENLQRQAQQDNSLLPTLPQTAPVGLPPQQQAESSWSAESAAAQARMIATMAIKEIQQQSVNPLTQPAPPNVAQPTTAMQQRTVPQPTGDQTAQLPMTTLQNGLGGWGGQQVDLPGAGPQVDPQNTLVAASMTVPGTTGVPVPVAQQQGGAVPGTTGVPTQFAQQQGGTGLGTPGGPGGA